MYLIFSSGRAKLKPADVETEVTATCMSILITSTAQRDRVDTEGGKHVSREMVQATVHYTSTAVMHCDSTYLTPPFNITVPLAIIDVTLLRRYYVGLSVSGGVKQSQPTLYQ